MTNANTKIEPQIGDLVAWESQAQGSWKTKIGRVTALADRRASIDARSSEAKHRVQILGEYPTPSNLEEAESGRLLTRSGRLGPAIEVRRIVRAVVTGKPSPNQIRAPYAWERQAVGL